MNELATKPISGSLEIQTMDDLDRVSEMLAKSGFFSDARGAAQAAVKVLAGAELGIGPFAAMTGIHIVEGKPMVGGNLMAAAVKRSDRYSYKVTEMTDKRVAITFCADGEAIGESVFTMEDAKAAGVQMKTAKGYATNWAKFPRNMLFNRAISNGVKWFCPDVFSTTFYVEGELPDGGGDPYAEDAPIDVEPARGTASLAAKLTAQRAAEADEDDVQDAEFTPAPAEDTEPVLRISRPQATAIAIALKEAGFKDSADGKVDGRRFVAWIAGIDGELASSNDLTREQAAVVLERLGDGDNGSFRTDPGRLAEALTAWHDHLDLQRTPDGPPGTEQEALPGFDPNERPGNVKGMKPIGADETTGKSADASSEEPF